MCIRDSLHISEPKLALVLDSGCFNNYFGLCGKDVLNAIMLFGKCSACAEGKMKAPKKISSKSQPASKVGERLAADIWALGCVSLGGNNCILKLVDEKSAYIILVPMKNKTNTIVEEALRVAIAEVNSYGHRVREILFDNEIVFNSVGTYLRERSIVPLYTPSGLHNNLSERYTQTVKRKKAVLEAALKFELPEYLIAETLMAAVRSCNKSIGFKSGRYNIPYSLMRGSKPNLDRYSYGSTGIAYTNRLDTPGIKAEWGYC